MFFVRIRERKFVGLPKSFSGKLGEIRRRAKILLTPKYLPAAIHL